MYAQAAIKPNTLLRNGAYGIVMRGVHRYVSIGDFVMLYHLRHGNRYIHAENDTI